MYILFLFHTLTLTLRLYSHEIMLWNDNLENIKKEKLIKNSASNIFSSQVGHIRNNNFPFNNQRKENQLF